MNKAQWHVNDEGDVRRCNADIKQCPLGKNNENRHADSKEGARKIAETMLSEKYPYSITKQDKSVPESLGFFPKSYKEKILNKDDEFPQDAFYTNAVDYTQKDLQPLINFHTLREIEGVLYKKKLMDADSQASFDYAKAENLRVLSDSSFGEYYRGFGHYRSQNLENAENKDFAFNDYTDELISSSFEKLPSEEREDLQKILDYAEKSSEFSNKLNAQELNALAFWTGHGSSVINQKILLNRDYEGDDFQTSNPADSETYLNVDKYAEIIDKCMDKAELNEETIVYRGVPAEALNNVLEGLSRQEIMKAEGKLKESFDSHYKTGDILNFESFSSSTADFDQTRVFGRKSNIVYKIKAKHGAPLGSVSAWGFREREYLLPRNTEYRIIGSQIIDRNDGTDATNANNCLVVEIEEI